jgi:hypothetical protein
MKNNLLLFCFICLCPFLLGAQEVDTLDVMSYTEPKDFEIGGITVVGANFSDDNAIIGVTGLKVGEKNSDSWPRDSQSHQSALETSPLHRCEGCTGESYR